MNNNNQHVRRVTFLQLLALAFIVLKLTNVIEWSWLFVLSPIWTEISIVLISFAISKVSSTKEK